MTGSAGGVPPLVVCDLDRTLIYSRSALDADPPALQCVERIRGADAAYLSAPAVSLLVELRRRSEFVPTTTRTREQYARVTLPGGPARFAIVANGGHLLCDGVSDPEWQRSVQDRLARCAPLAEVRDRLRAPAHGAWLLRERSAEELFCYAVVERDLLPADVVAELTAWAADRGWAVSLQGRKLYLVPVPLTKSAAAAEVAWRTGADTVLAAGDSLLDADLLEYADVAVRPAHGELHDTGWKRPGLVVTAAAGVRAGEELLRVLLSRIEVYAGARD